MPASNYKQSLYLCVPTYLPIMKGGRRASKERKQRSKYCCFGIHQQQQLLLLLSIKSDVTTVACFSLLFSTLSLLLLLLTINTKTKSKITFPNGQHETVFFGRLSSEPPTPTTTTKFYHSRQVKQNSFIFKMLELCSLCEYTYRNVFYRYYYLY